MTGGSGDLGTLLAGDLAKAGHKPANIDMAAPKTAAADFVKGSILDRMTLAKAMEGAEMAVHIAAWHGIHEVERTKTPEEFHDLNVTGTFNMLEAAAQAGAKKFIFISSTSAHNIDTVYGHTKVLGEEMCRAYAVRHGMDVIILRPRAFIPSWNKPVYKDFSAWSNWFMRGAVHIVDVNQSVLKSVARLTDGAPLPEAAPALTVDGAHEYTAADLDAWDENGAGSTFRKYYPADIERALAAGLDIARKPKVLDISKTRELIGYKPAYSMRNMLDELKTYGVAGPPAPF